MSRRIALIAGATVFAVGALALGFSADHLLRMRAGATSASTPKPASVGGPFSLIDHNGARVTDRDFVGKPFLVFFGFTHCPDVCPTALFEMSEILNRLGPDAERMNALFVTVDPERDRAEVLKTYLSSFNPRITGLTGTPDEVAAAAKAYRAYMAKVPRENGDYSMDHTAVVYLMDKAGRFVAPFNIKQNADAAARELRPYL